MSVWSLLFASTHLLLQGCNKDKVPVQDGEVVYKGSDDAPNLVGDCLGEECPEWASNALLEIADRVSDEEFEHLEDLSLSETSSQELSENPSFENLISATFDVTTELGLSESNPFARTSEELLLGIAVVWLSFAEEESWCASGRDCLVVISLGAVLESQNNPESTDVTVDSDGDGVSIMSGDCDDENPNIHPYTEELCNQIDDNCDGLIDNNAYDATTWYVDNDGDGFGDGSSSQTSCSQPSGYVADSSDCNDEDPMSASLPDDGDCDGVSTEDDCDDSDPSTVDDMDCDGFVTADDCNDYDADINPSASDLLLTDRPTQ